MFHTLQEGMTPQLFEGRWMAKSKNAFASAFKDSTRLTARSTALRSNFVQVNAKSGLNLMTIDFDNADSMDVIPQLVSAGVMPEPSFTVFNMFTGHALIGFFVSGLARSKKAKKLFKEVQARLTRTLAPYGADLGYRGFTMRNPLASAAFGEAYDLGEGLRDRSEFRCQVEWGTAHEYHFSELWSFTEDEDASGAQAQGGLNNSSASIALDPASVNRNSNLFDAVRGWAYSMKNSIGRDEEAYAAAITAYAMAQNAKFEKPLPEYEVSATAASITKFAITKLSFGTKALGANGSKKPFLFNHTPEAQSARSRKRAVVQMKPDNYSSILELAENGMKAPQIAEKFGITPAAARKRLSRAKAWMKEQTTVENIILSETEFVDVVTGEVFEVAPTISEEHPELAVVTVLVEAPEHESVPADQQRGFVTEVNMADFFPAEFFTAAPVAAPAPVAVEPVREDSRDFMKSLLGNLVAA